MQPQGLCNDCLTAYTPKTVFRPHLLSASSDWQSNFTRFSVSPLSVLQRFCRAPLLCRPRFISVTLCVDFWRVCDGFKVAEMSEAEDNDILELDSEPEDGDVEMCLMTDVGEFQHLYWGFLVFIACSFTRLRKKEGILLSFSLQICWAYQKLLVVVF